MTRNRKIKEFLDSDIYLELIKELGRDNFNKELQSVEIEFDILTAYSGCRKIFKGNKKIV